MNKIIQNILKVIIFALPAVALVVPSDMFFPFITGKAFLFRLAVELAFFLYIALAISDSAYRPKWNALSIAFAVFAAVMLVADIFAVNPSKALWSNFERMDGFVTLAHLFIYFFVASSVLKNKKDWQGWLLSSVGISVYLIFFCFLQLSGEIAINQGGVRVDGSLGNAAYLGAYLVFQFFFLVYLWLSSEVDFKGIGRSIMAGGFAYSIYYLIRISPEESLSTTPGLIIFAVAFLLSISALVLSLSKGFGEKYKKISAHSAFAIIAAAYLVVLYFTATRGAILGLIGGVIIGAVFLLIKAKEDKLIRNVSLGILAAICLAVGVFYLSKDTSFVKSSPVLSRFSSLSLDTKGQARNYVWPMALEGSKERPILGWGQEGFNYVFQKYYVPEMITQEPFFDRAHNSFLDWLVAGGALGLLAYLSLYIISFIFIIRSASFSSKEKAVLIGLLAAYSFQNLFIFDNLTSYIFFASFLALVASRSTPKEDEAQRGDSVNAVTILLCAIGFIVVAYLVNSKAYLQNTTLIKGISPQAQISENLAYIKKAISYHPLGAVEAREQLIRVAFQIIAAPNAPDDTKVAFANAVVEEMSKQIEATPKDARMYLVFGDFLVKIGAYDQAIPVLEKGIELSPKKQQIIFTLARAYMGKANQNNNSDDAKRAVELVKGAYDLAPQYDSVRAAYISALLTAGNVADAVEIIKELEDPSIIIDSEIIKILVENRYADLVESMLKKAILINNQNADAYIMLSNVYVAKKDKNNAIKALEDLKAAIPSLAEEVEKDIAAVNAYFK